MKTDTKESEKLTGLLKEAESHPLMKQILVEKAAAVLATRNEAAGKIEVLRKEQAETIPKLQEVLAGKEAAYLAAKTALDAATDEWRTAKATLLGEVLSFDSKIHQHERVLHETADPAINEAIQFFREKLDWLRMPGRTSSRGMEIVKNIFTEKITHTTETNRASVLSAMEYCRAAIKTLEDMKLCPALDLQRIEALKKGIPDIGVFTEVTGERPLPGSKGINPLHHLKSDSQTNWEIGKINEKFKRVVGR